MLQSEGKIFLKLSFPQLLAKKIFMFQVEEIYASFLFSSVCARSQTERRGSDCIHEVHYAYQRGSSCHTVYEKYHLMVRNYYRLFMQISKLRM